MTRSVSRVGKSRKSQPSRKAPMLIWATVIGVSLLLALSPLLQAGVTGQFASSRISGNSCSCHGTTYTEYVIIDNYTIPSQILIGQTLDIHVNVSINSTAYYPAKSTYWLCDLTVTVTSVNARDQIKGSPKINNSVMPGFQREYVFNMTGFSAGTDSIKIDAKIRTHHYGVQVTDTRTGSVLVIKPKAPPVLSNGKVSPVSGFNQTDFTYRVTYTDDDGDPPTAIMAIIDEKPPRAMTLFDGKLDSILTGEDYIVKVNGTALGLGNHSFRFTATEGLFEATGDNWTHQGPKVSVYVAPNRPPTVTIAKPTTGSSIIGLVNISGTATDPDTGDAVDVVEVNVDNGTWSKVNGTNNWAILWDFANTTTGAHAIYARATDGKNYSKPIVSYVYVEKLIVLPPSVAINGYHYFAENLMEVTGTSAQGNNSGPVSRVEIWADPIGGWSQTERKGTPLSNGTPSYDAWSWVWNTTGIEDEQYTLSVRAWAGPLVSPIINIDVEVIKFNHRPVIISFDPISPVSMYEGGAKTLMVTAADPDGDSLTYSWLVDKQPKAPIGDPTLLEFKASYSSAGPHTVTITISDGNEENGTATYVWDITVLDAFVITDLSDLGDGTLESGEVQPFMVSVLDPEGGKISYVWTVDGQKDDTGLGPNYNFAYESRSAQTTHHSIVLKVSNSRGSSQDMKWDVFVKGTTTGNGNGNGNGKDKKQPGAIGQVITVLMLVLVLISIVYTIYAIVKGRGRKGTIDPDATAVTDGSTTPPNPQFTEQPPPAYQGDMQVQPQGYEQYHDQSHKGPGSGGL